MGGGTHTQVKRSVSSAWIGNIDARMFHGWAGACYACYVPRQAVGMLIKESILPPLALA